MRSFLFVALLAISTIASAQNITGHIKTADGKPLNQVTVQLLRQKDSSVAKLAVTDAAGNYKMEAVRSGKYLLKASHIGYDNAFSTLIEVGTGDVKAPTMLIARQSGELKGVTVTARKPMIEVKADKTILNVENTINAVGQDALELLRKAPGVLVDKDDNLSLSGKNGVQVYVDGRPSPLSGKDLSDYLKTMQSSQIEAIEVITNPSAKYDAAGNAGIINIRLKKDKSMGTNGSANAGYNIGIFAKYNAGLSLNNRNRKTNLFANYNYNRNNGENFMDLYRRVDIGSTPTPWDSLFDQHTTMRNQGHSHGFKAGLDYYVSKRTTFGLMANGNFNRSDMGSRGTTFISYFPTKQLDRTLLVNNKNEMKRDNLNLNANYRFADSSGRELNMDVDYGMYRTNSNQLQPNYYHDNAGNLTESVVYNMVAPSEIDIYSYKLDYEQPFEKGRLSLGGKIAFVDARNDFKRYNMYPLGKELDSARSNNFKYTENINAVYANYNRQFKGFMIQLGLRVENTNATGVSDGQKWNGSKFGDYDSTFKRNYTDFFPSASITFNKNPKSQFSFTYSRRIDRPAYQDLNPFEFKLDEYTFQKGNTELTPQYTNSFGVTHTYKYKLTTTLNYSHVNDVFSQYIDTAEQTKSFMTKKNLATQDIVSLNISYPFQYKFYSLFLNVNSYYSHFKANFGKGKEIDLDVYAVTVYGQNSFKLSKVFTAELGGWYSSPSIWQGTFKSKAMWALDAGLMASLAKGKINVKASLTDIFQTQRWSSTSENSAQQMRVSGGWESRQFRLNLTYRFGNNQVKAARQRKTGMEDESKRASGGGGGLGGN